MTDIFSKEKRSKLMSKIKGKDTKPEILVRKFIFSKGFRFRKNDKRYPGTPDIVLPKYKTVIFVQGCFWHGHDCKYSTIPESNHDFWVNKIEQNKLRDKKNNQLLKEQGWNVIVIWGCKLKTIEKKEETLNKLMFKLTS